MPVTKAKPTPVFGAVALDGEKIVALPVSQLQESLGRQLYFQHQQSAIPQLCRQAHDPKECRNLHPTSTYLQQLDSSDTKPCCAYCGDPYSRALLDDEGGDSRLQLLGPIFFQDVMYPIERMMITTAVISVTPMETVSSLRVCQEHLLDTCPRSKDCTLLHLCRKRAESAEAPYFTKAPIPQAPFVGEPQSVPPEENGNSTQNGIEQANGSLGNSNTAPLIDLHISSE